MVTEVKSPWSSDPAKPNPRAGTSPGAFSSPSVARPDSGHVAPHVGKNALTNPRLQADNAAGGDIGFQISGSKPVQGATRDPADPRG